MIEEWRELTKLVNTYLGPLPEMIGEDGRLHTTFNQAVAATGRLSTSNPNLQAIPIRTELGREIRSAFVAEEGSSRYRPTTRKSSCASSPKCPASRSSRLPSLPARTSTPPTAAEVLGRDAVGADEGRARDREDDQLRHRLRHLRARALAEPPDPARRGADVHRQYLARFPHVQDFIARTIEEAKRDGYVTSLAMLSLTWLSRIAYSSSEAQMIGIGVVIFVQ